MVVVTPEGTQTCCRCGQPIVQVLQEYRTKAGRVKHRATVIAACRQSKVEQPESRDFLHFLCAVREQGEQADAK